MNYFAHDRLGRSVPQPTFEQMQELLDSLAALDPEHPDVSVQSESGWCISAFGSGMVVLENVETGEGPWHLASQRVDQVLDLWSKLVSNDISSVRAAPWLDGYGPNA